MLDEFKRLIKNKYFWFYIGAVTAFFILWFGSFPLTFKIVSLFILIVSQGFLIVKVVTNTDISSTFYKWTYFIVLIFLAVAYLAASVKDVDIAKTTIIIIIPIILIIGVCISVIFSVWQSKKPMTLIVNYVFLAVMTIMLFAYGFAVAGLCAGNEVELVSGHIAVTEFWALINFSTQVFYSNCYGDIIPLGYSNILASIELVFSAIIHIIVLGIVISRITTSAKVNGCGNPRPI